MVVISLFIRYNYKTPIGSLFIYKHLLIYVDNNNDNNNILSIIIFFF